MKASLSISDKIILSPVWLITLLPLRILYLVSDFLFLLTYHIIQYRKQVVIGNLEKSFPNYSKKKIQQISRRFYRYLCDYFIESIYLLNMSEKECDRRYTYRNSDVLEKLFREGRSIIIATSHYGNWEWATNFQNHFSHRLYGIYKPLRNKRFDRLFINLRSRYGSTPIPMKHTMRRVVDSIQQKEIFALYFVADQRPRLKEVSYWMNFMNQETPVITGMGKLAKKFNMPIVFMNIVRPRRGYYEITHQLIEAEPADKTYGQIIENYMRQVERLIHEKPELYLWSHKRWKYKPEQFKMEEKIKMMQRVAVVILNWNGKSYLERFLPSVSKFSQGDDIQIVIVDNNSDDDSCDFVKSSYPEMKLIKFNQNFGFAKGYALALPQIAADYYVLLNSDVEVTENWLNPIIDMMEKDKDIAAAMPKILSHEDTSRFEYAGAAGGFIDRYGYPFCRGRILAKIEKDEGQYDDTREIFWASGACMILRANAYSRTGGLDGDFFAHMEEIDLCWRLKRLGYKINYCSESVVYHVGGGTLPNNNPRKLYYNYRNSLYLLFKNISYLGFFTILLPRMILDGLSAMAYLLQGKVAFFTSVIRAHIRFYLSLRMLIHKRRIFNKIIAKAEVSQIYPGSIVYSFFFKRKTKFKDLDYK